MASSAGISFAQAAQKEQKKAELVSVQVEGQVILKIAKHCREHASGSSVVTGQLLGLDVGQTLEVTDCFPFPGNVGDEEAETSNEGEGYQLEMMRCLREVNVDNNMVGWYQSTVSGSYQVVEIIETFVNYLENLDRCICMVYDTLAAASGGLGLKAVRLTEAFVKAFREGTLTVEKVRTSNLSWQSIFQEIPITVHNTPLAVALAAAITPVAHLSARDAARLTLASAPVLERNVEFLNDCLDDNTTRRTAGEEMLGEEPPEGMFKPPPEPSALDGMLLLKQMTSYCDAVGSTSAQAIQRLVIAEGLQRRP
ncbi:Eukaryotic translation initiation factor 3 subunit H [Auxenochlorella protothecoides]|uniref:Eukaryotic translation initiation factor 3 subunit H n=1 Tax=Auxenochlorella protothecoides TaxID=3075 RepID=A0A087SRS3_AUXPR|nr:Eukaryotic translation initiation factor 3 subunit H [Auxenochlorella protothecoides]KFM28427.1 Eukaryotic translation initiation factor 3 subunit H [Auxenochlorella protothecoides]